MKKCLRICIAFTVLISGCVTQAEKFSRMRPVEISKWSDAELCTNGYRENPAIKKELLKRNLVSEQEFEYLFQSNEHKNFPAVGMRKCAIWAFTNWQKLLSETKLPDGSSKENWKVHKGEYIIFMSTGGAFYRITIQHDRITEVSPL